MARRKAFLLRIEPKIFDALQKWADDEFRSVNGHIEYLLSRELRRAGRLDRDSKGDRRDSKGDRKEES